MGLNAPLAKQALSMAQIPAWGVLTQAPAAQLSLVQVSVSLQLAQGAPWTPQRSRAWLASGTQAPLWQQPAQEPQGVQMQLPDTQS